MRRRDAEARCRSDIEYSNSDLPRRYIAASLNVGLELAGTRAAIKLYHKVVQCCTTNARVISIKSET